jgi:4-hydroxyphenylpyruvate dioxygenase-like putative hemolysin
MVDLSNAIAVLELIGSTVEPCGSRVTCNPPPTDTDLDYLVVVAQHDEAISSIVSELSRLGFHWEGSVHYQTAASDGFMSWRGGDVNFIVTASAEFARKHRAATALCTRLNLMNKQDRIALFQAVLYGNQWDGAGDAPKEPQAAVTVTEEEVLF